jgi:hypothetical protein
MSLPWRAGGEASARRRGNGDGDDTFTPAFRIARMPATA